MWWSSLAKIGLKYAVRWKAAARLIGKVEKLVGGIIDVAKNWGKVADGVADAQKAYDRAKASAKAARAADEGADAAESGETYYRAMKSADFDELNTTGRMPATGETMVTTMRSFADNYDGVLVKFTVRPGTPQPGHRCARRHWCKGHIEGSGDQVPGNAACF